MAALYFLVIFCGYHGAVLWLALRFKGKTWYWYWFAGVLLIGIGYAWWDRLFIYAVLEKDWCERPEVGFHELAPVKIKTEEITWLTPARWPNGNIKGSELDDDSSKLVQETTFFKDGDTTATTTNRLICEGQNKHNVGNSGACIASGYRVQTEQKEVHFLGRHLATQERNLLLHGDTVLRDSVSYRWGSNWFLRGTVFTPSAGGGCGIGLDWSNATETKSVTIEE